jgi:hypothetical protein
MPQRAIHVAAINLRVSEPLVIDSRCSRGTYPAGPAPTINTSTSEFLGAIPTKGIGRLSIKCSIEVLIMKEAENQRAICKLKVRY